MLAETDGDAGFALHLAIGYALASAHAGARNDAVDAMLGLAARTQLDGRRLGEHLGLLAARQDITPRRLVAPLRDAARGGAALEVQHTLTELLEAVLAGGASLPAWLADVLALTAEVVDSTRVRTHIPGLAELASRRGGSRQVIEARRLQDLFEDLA
jgi:hypothetical protein